MDTSTLEIFKDFFQTKTYKFVAILAITGILISIYLFNESLSNYRLEKKVMILKELLAIQKELPTPNNIKIINNDILVIYNQSVVDLKEKSSDLATNISNVFTLAENSPISTYIYKFFSGGIMLLILFILRTSTFFTYVKKNLDKIKTKDTLHIIVNIYYISLWLIPSIINMLIPLFRNQFINYLFIPSILTLITMLVDNIHQEATTKRIYVNKS